MPALEEFHPPYCFGAYGCVVLGVWETKGPEGLVLPGLEGFEPVRWLGGHLGTVLALHYDRPPAQYPVPYSEIIFAWAVRRGARWAAVPFDLVLDDEFNVRAGRYHYHLPKRFDPSLRIDVESDASGAARRLTATSAGLELDAALEEKKRVSAATGIVSRIFSAMTEHGPVIGTAGEPFLRAYVHVRPEATTARRARVSRLAVSGRTLRPLYAQFWSSLSITLGAPHPLAVGGGVDVG